MKPNLFRSISNAYTHSFPLLPRIRRSFLGLMLFCVVFIMVGFSVSDTIVITVKPVGIGVDERKALIAYSKAHLSAGNELVITDPGVLERVLVPNAMSGFGLDLVTLLFLFFASLIIVMIVPKLQQNNLFRKDISDSLRWLGYLVMVHGLFSIYREINLVPGIIERHTNNAFTSVRTFPIPMIAEIHFSLVLLAFASMYKRGIKLQAEQDLTV